MKIKNMLLPMVGIAGALLLPMAAQAQTAMTHPYGINQRLEN